MPPTLIIAKRELASYFNSPLAYVVICLSQVLLGVAVFLMGKYWQVDRATLLPLFNYAPFGLGWLIIPVVTMRLVAEEKSSGTLEMLITLPVRDWEVILGKYLGALTLVLILIGSTLLYPLMMFRYWKLGPLDMGPVWSGYLGLSLMSAAGVAIGLLVSALTRSQVIAFFVTFVVLFALVTVDQAGDLASNPKVGAVIQYVSFHAHVQNFARGLIDTRSILYFVTLTAFSLMVAFRALESRKWTLAMAMERRTRAATESGVYLLVIAAIVIAANVLGFMTHKRFDVTKAERFTLSKGSGRMVHDLKRPITVKAYISNTGLAKIDTFTRDLDDLMKEYERAGGGKFIYQKINPKTDAEKQEAKDYGLKEITAAEGSETGDDQAQIAQGYMGLVFLYGNEKDVIAVLSPEGAQGLEFWISNKIREVRDKADDIFRRVGLITGKDEIKLGDTNLVPSPEGGGRGAPSMRSVMENAFPYYKFEDVDLKGGETEIDGNLDAVLITQAGKDYTDKELRRIDQFLMKDNKALVVYASAVNMKEGDAHMGTTLNTHNLEKLLSGYGIDMKKDSIFDLARPVRIQVMTAAGQMLQFRHPAVVQAQAIPGIDEEHQMLDASFVGFFRMDELTFPFPSTLEVHKDKQPNATVKVVARTTPQAFADTAPTQDLGMKAQWLPKPPAEQRVIAASVEGQIKSAFGGGDADGVKIEAQSKTKNRVLVVSSAQFLANPLARQGNGQTMQGQMGMMMPVGGDRQLQALSQSYAQKFLTNTILSFKNTLDWATGDADLVATSAKILGEANLTYSEIARVKIEATDDEASLKKKDEEYKTQRKRVQANVQLTLILLTPILFAGFGILRWQMRERRRALMKL
jgi:ABC-type transport system involved in multi-copper enzyme maturation permease subunit